MRSYVLLIALVACGGSSGNGVDGGSGGGGGGGSGSGSNKGSGSGSGGGGGGGGSGSNAALVECVTQTNAYRAMNGKSALTESTDLETYAATGAMFDYQNMSAHDHFSTTQGGGIAFAENECPGFEGWNISNAGGDMTSLMDMCLQAFYDEGPGSDYNTHGHYINMMGDYGTLGCGIYEDSSTGDVTIVQDYGM
jgi:Cysteine-rich secretory protein family